MPLTKYTMIFTYNSGITETNQVPIRTGGWSESFYGPDQNAETEAAFRSLIQARLSIAPRGTSVGRYRMQEVDPVGRATLRKCAYAAPNTWLSDVPQMALKVQFGGQTALGAFYREFRGTPDIQVTTGEYTPSGPFRAAVATALDALSTSVFKAWRRDKSKVSFKVQSIAAGGIVTMIQPTDGINVNTEVQVLRSIDPSTGRRIGYFARVTNFIDASHFTIAGESVKVSNFGKIRVAARVPVGFSNPDIANIEAVVRKVGRPFKAYSGRVSKKK